MPVYNGERFIKFAIDSLLNQTYKEIEIIILDNKSSDRTREICAEIKKTDYRVRYILDKEKRTSHEAADEIIKHVNGEFCMIACDDDVWDPYFIEKLVQELIDNKEINMVFSEAKSNTPKVTW